MPGALVASMGSVGQLDRSRISSPGPGGRSVRFDDNIGVLHLGLQATAASRTAMSQGPPTNPFAMSQVGYTSSYPTMDKFYTEDGTWAMPGGSAPQAHWQNQDDKVSESSDDYYPPPPYPEAEHEDAVYEQIVHRDPLVSRTGTSFAGDIPEQAFAHLHNQQAHPTHQVEHRLRKAQDDHAAAQWAHHHAERELRAAHDHHAHHHHHMQNPAGFHGANHLINNRHPDTDPSRVYQYGEHHGHPVLEHGAGNLEADFWVGAGTPAARLEPTWIGGEWYLVAPVDLKGLENSDKTNGFPIRRESSDGAREFRDEQQRRHFQNELRVVDGAAHQMESQINLPPPRHWKEHKNCPIA